MFNKENYLIKTTTETLKSYINNDLYEIFTAYLEKTYNIKPVFEFSKCYLEYGWNIKMKKGSKNICTIYPRENYFTVLLVISKKHQESLNSIYQSLTPLVKDIIEITPEGNGQKWLMIDLEDLDNSYEDVKKLIALKVKIK